MKKLFNLLILVPAMLCMTACPELMPDIPDSLEIETTEYSIPSEGGQIEIRFMSLVDWTVTSDVAWLTYSPSSGAASEQEAVITVTVDPNNSSQRTAQLTVSSVFDDVVIVVTQAGKDETPEPEVSDTPDNPDTPDVPVRPDTPDTPDVPQDWLLCRTTDIGNTWENFEFTSYEDGMLIYKNFYVQPGSYIRFHDVDDDVYYGCSSTYKNSDFKTNSRIDLVSGDDWWWFYFSMTNTYDIYVLPQEKQVFIMTPEYSPYDLPTMETVLCDTYASLQGVADGNIVKVHGTVMAINAEGYILAIGPEYYNNIFVYDPAKLHDVTLGCWLDIYARVQTDRGLKNLMVDNDVSWSVKTLDQYYEYAAESSEEIRDLDTFDDSSHSYIRVVGTFSVVEDSYGKGHYTLVDGNGTSSQLVILSPLEDLTNFDGRRVLVEGYYMGRDNKEGIVCQNIILRKIYIFDEDSTDDGSTEEVRPGGSITVTNNSR